MCPAREQEQIGAIVYRIFFFPLDLVRSSNDDDDDDDDRERNQDPNSRLFSFSILANNFGFNMKKSLARQSTWLILEISATSLLTILNLCIPIFLSFKSFRNLINFYFASLALSSSLINFLYLFYLIQTFREKPLSELNCRAMFYFQTSCIIVLGKFDDDDDYRQKNIFFSISF